MDSSPLPRRARPPTLSRASSSASGSTFLDSNRRNPFTIAAAASLSRANSAASSMSASESRQPAATQESTQASTQSESGGGEASDDIEDSDKEDNDESDESDELAGGGARFTNSSYFTQPTQLVNQRTTQPTQILQKPLTTLKGAVRPAAGSSSFAASLRPLDTVPINILSSSPPPPPSQQHQHASSSSVVEVPASSPVHSPPRTASSPVAARGRLASLMAPAGTAFRSPMQQAKAQQQQENSRAKPDDEPDDDDDVLDKIIRIADSSDEEQASRTPARGDIRPASFRRPPSLSPSPQTDNNTAEANEANDPDNKRKMPNDRKIAILVAKMQALLRKRGFANASTDACRTALLAHYYSVEESVSDMLAQRRGEKQPLAPSKVPEMIRSFAYQANGGGGGDAKGPRRSSITPVASTASRSRAASSSPATPTSQQSQKRSALSPSPRPKRRRLVQGRKYRGPPSSQLEALTPADREESRLVDLTRVVGDDEDEDDEDEEDAEDDTFNVNGGPNSTEPIVLSDGDDDDDALVEMDQSGDSDDDGDAAFDVEKRVLEYLNTCTVDDLVAMLGARARGKAETILSHRPFRTRASVTRITNNAKKKAANIGEDIFDAVEEYVVALRAIDVVVAQCEQKGLQIRSALYRWDVDFRGSSKAVSGPDGDGKPDGSDGLMTPASEFGPGSAAGSKNGYVPLPIPQEPVFLRGHCTMKGYQLYGLNWLWELYRRRFGCILADDMGLGKTCQVISFLSHLIESYKGSDDEAPPWPNLVIVPPSTLANWQAEFKKFAPAVRVTTYSGHPTERDAIFHRIQANRAKHHVVLTSYSQLSGKQDLDAMRRVAPNVAIFDEGHKMKNANTALYKSLRRIEAHWRLILTGTPVQNNLMEMINLLNFIQPSLFERHLEKLGALFSQRFTLQDVSNGALLFSDRVRRARSILEPFILQRRKEQVLASMPAKTTRLVYCELDATQKPIYEAYERQFRQGKDKGGNGDSGVSGVSGGDTTERSRRQAAARSAVTGLSNDQNNVWVQLRKAAIHAQLFRRYYDDATVDKMARVLMAEVPQAELRQPDMKHLVNELRDCSDFELHTWCRDYHWCLAPFDMPEARFLESGKVHALLALVQEFTAHGDRALVFTRFARVLNILRECLTHAGVRYVSLEGATRVEERQAIIDEYNDNADIPVFLLTTGSGGTGINLTAANKVVIFDQSDNPQDDVQAENRAHRLGQTRPVEVIRLVTRGTIEELVYKACQTKLELAQRVTAGSAVAQGGWETGMEDGERVAKAVEEEVRRMLLAGEQGEGTTPPKSDGGM